MKERAELKGNDTTNRRGFLKRSAVMAATAPLAGASAPDAAVHVPEESKRQIQLGLIGCGGRGPWLAEFFQDLRSRETLKGRCGVCEYRKVCGGCRARAYALQGDVFAEEPYCAHQPSKMDKA